MIDRALIRELRLSGSTDDAARADHLEYLLSIKPVLTSRHKFHPDPEEDDLDDDE